MERKKKTNIYNIATESQEANRRRRIEECTDVILKAGSPNARGTEPTYPASLIIFDNMNFIRQYRTRKVDLLCHPQPYTLKKLRRLLKRISTASRSIGPKQ